MSTASSVAVNPPTPNRQDLTINLVSDDNDDSVKIATPARYSEMTVFIQRIDFEIDF